MAIVLSLVEHKINSFLTNGFLSGAELQQLMQKDTDHTITTSYDTKLRDQVPLNCITRIDGIKVSLLNPAKGGLVVMTEERVGQKGILDEALERNAEAIAMKKQDFSFLSSYADSAARNFVLSKDVIFLEAVTKKVHQTALFILQELGIDSGENQAIDGCKETGRNKILPEKIAHIILPISYRDEIVNIQVDKLIFVDSIQSEFIFCYKDERDAPQQIKIEKGIKIPDYAGVLERLFSERESGANLVYTHMTRLP